MDGTVGHHLVQVLLVGELDLLLLLVGEGSLDQGDLVGVMSVWGHGGIPDLKAIGRIYLTDIVKLLDSH